MRIYKPEGEGPFPTLIFNHGSTGYSTDPERFKESVDAPAVAEFFVQRGWAVVMPARRGRAGSDGLYDEGLSLNRAGYSCDSSLSLAGADLKSEPTQIDCCLIFLNILRTPKPAIYKRKK